MLTLHPKELKIIDFTYDLPQNKIAAYPLAERDQSKLLIYKNGKIGVDTYKNIDDQLTSETLLIFNNTKVVEARILFTKETGSTIEIFCLEPDDRYKDVTNAMLQHSKVFWKCLVGGAKKWKSEKLSKPIEINRAFPAPTARTTAPITSAVVKLSAIGDIKNAIIPVSQKSCL